MNTIIFCFAFLFLGYNCQAQATKKDSTITFKVRKPVVSETEMNQEDKKVKPQTGTLTNIEFIPEIFTVVEQMPVFPGGEGALMNYIGRNLKYPEEAKKTGVFGTAYLGFIIDTVGNIANIQLLKSSGSPLLDQEAIRVINMMPAWAPGRRRGLEVAVQMTLPVHFKLK